MYGCKFRQGKERKVVTRNFEFMVEKLCGPLKTVSWPTTGPWPTARLKTSGLAYEV